MIGAAEYSGRDGLGLAELVARGEATAAELCEEAIARIDAVDSQLNAIVHRMFREGRAVAAGALPAGPFRGVPFLLKDLGAMYAGTPTTGSSRFYEGFVPPYDSELVRRYKAAGLVVLGKTNTPELGLLPVTEPKLRGPTHNPWRLGHTAGGSSGGAAAAVAAGIVPMAHGGDGGGSIRIPASCCGLFGFKPSRGRMPTGPAASEGWRGFVTDHALTRSVRDSAALLDATAGPEVGGWISLPKPSTSFLEAMNEDGPRLRIALATKPFLPASPDRDCIAAAEAAARVCEGLGHHVEPCDIDLDPTELAVDYLTVIAVATAAAIARDADVFGVKATRHDFEESTWLVAMLGEQTSAVVYERAFDRLQAVARRMGRFHERYDVVLSPTLGLTPPRIGQLEPRSLDAFAQRLVVGANLGPLLRIPKLVEQLASKVFELIPYTPLANITGQPSMSVPLHWNAQNLPVGSMFTARVGDDALLFRLARELEDACPWKNRRPVVHTY
jgi:amidase